MKLIIYVKTSEEAQLKALEFKNKDVEIVVVPEEVITAFQAKINTQLATKENKRLKAHEEFKAFNYDRESSKRSQLKMKLFGTFLVSDKELEEVVVHLIKKEVSSKKV